ncbi:MAG: T9SS type A sorting domain-containing protein [Bacteroidia bacterium]
MKRLLSLLLIFASAVNLQAQIKFQSAINSNGNKPYQMVISPDNKFAYVITSGEIQTYQRNPANGQLTFLSGVSHMQNGASLYAASNIALSADAKFVYTEGIFDVFTFRRDSVTGLLTPFQTLSDGYYPPITPCTHNDIVSSKDNKFVYITGRDNLFIYQRNASTDSLSLVDTLQNVIPAGSSIFDISMLLSSDNKLAFITGGHSVSVFGRDTVTGLLHFKNIISGSNSANQGLAYARESVRSSNDKYIYTATNSMGSGAVVVLEKTNTDSLKIIQSLPNNIRPYYINISPDNKLLCVSSGVATPTSALMFFSIDSASGKLTYVSTFLNSERYDQTKCFDLTNRYLYSMPAFTDSIYIHRLSLFLDSADYFCPGNNKTLHAWENYTSYVWSTGSTNSSITVNTPGKYALTATDNFGYTFTDTISVGTFPLPAIYLGRDTSLLPGQSIYLDADPTFVKWRWNVNNDSTYFLELVNDGSFLGEAGVVVTVTDVNGCLNSDSILINFLPAPNKIPQTRIYPNPANAQFTIEPDVSGPYTVDMNDITGRYVFNKTLSGKTSIDVAGFDEGTYTLSIKTINSTTKKKLVVIHH